MKFSSEEINVFRKRYFTELTEQIIPFWCSHGIDKEYGGYFTSLDRTGKVFDTTKWMWMQWRIVYMFATFYSEIEQKEEWLNIAKNGFDFLTTHARAEDGSYYFAVNRQGEPVVAPYDNGSNYFAAMAAAALFMATGEEKYRKAAEESSRIYISRLSNPKGRWSKAMSATKKYRTHAAAMCLVNLATIVKTCTGSSELDGIAEKSVDEILGKFWNPEYRIVFENINSDYSFDLDSYDGRHINPGHGLESMWFIMDYGEKLNRPDIIKRAAEIVKAQIKFGYDHEYGGLFYFMDVLGKPHLELQWDMKLWWPHCETLIALLYAYRLTGDDWFADQFRIFDKWTWEHFRDPEYPEWFAYLNRRGEITHTLKGGKWKTMFHLPRCLHLCTQQLDKLF